MKDEKSQLKKILEEQRKEYQKYFDFVYRQKIRKDFRAIGEVLGHHTEKLQKLDLMVAKNTEDIEIIKLGIQFIKNALKKKVDLEEFEVLERRVTVLERKLKAS